MARVDSEIARLIWDSRYRYRDAGGKTEPSVEATWRRVARAVASVEADGSALWEERFYQLMREFRFLPGGRILAGAGTHRDVTLFNCFVMGEIGDSLDAIFDALREGAVTMQQGGGVGYDFSTLRPAGSAASRVGTVASGPVSFMDLWDSMCSTLLATATRRGAMMATLRCDHPDIEAFVDAKRDPRALRNFNLSVLVSDRFMDAVQHDELWPLVFPLKGLGGGTQAACLERVQQVWSGSAQPVTCAVLKRLPARALWQRIMRASYQVAEPGVLFIDRINRENNLHYREFISASNPCGEIPLPPYGACNLGSINLTRFVQRPFSGDAALEWGALESTAADAVRFLDNVIDLSRFPFAAQARQARGSRRIGLGITGLADALIMLGLHYDSDRGRGCAAEIMRRVCHSAYRSSTELAREKGPFPFFQHDGLLASPFVGRLPSDIRVAVTDHGLRNSHLTAIAPSGTISLFAGNVSSGIEPVFEPEARRRVRSADGKVNCYRVVDYALRCWREQFGARETPPGFVGATELPPTAHLAMQAALQAHVDNAISKTISIPRDYPFEAYESLYTDAWRLGLKGCTSFRSNPVTGEILSPGNAEQADAGQGDTPGPHCCGLHREGY